MKQASFWSILWFVSIVSASLVGEAVPLLLFKRSDFRSPIVIRESDNVFVKLLPRTRTLSSKRRQSGSAAPLLKLPPGLTPLQNPKVESGKPPDLTYPPGLKQVPGRAGSRQERDTRLTFPPGLTPGHAPQAVTHQAQGPMLEFPPGLRPMQSTAASLRENSRTQPSTNAEANRQRRKRRRRPATRLIQQQARLESLPGSSRSRHQGATSEGRSRRRNGNNANPATKEKSSRASRVNRAASQRQSTPQTPVAGHTGSTQAPSAPSVEQSGSRSRIQSGRPSGWPAPARSDTGGRIMTGGPSRASSVQRAGTDLEG